MDAPPQHCGHAVGPGLHGVAIGVLNLPRSRSTAGDHGVRSWHATTLEEDDDAAAGFEDG